MSFESFSEFVPPEEKKEPQDTNLEGSFELAQKIIEEAEKIKIEENQRNKDGELLVSPEGPVSNLGRQNELYWKMARTETFKDFFGDWQNNPEIASKVVDKNGEPLVVFRGVGTSKEGKVRDPYDPNTYNEEHQKEMFDNGPGVYFSSFPDIAFGYAHASGVVFPAFANCRKPEYTNFIRANIAEARKMLSTMAYILIPEKLLKHIPKLSLSNKDKYDSFFGKKRGIWRNEDFSKNPEELYEIAVKDVRQMLIIPNPIQKPEKPITEYTIKDETEKPE